MSLVSTQGISEQCYRWDPKAKKQRSLGLESSLLAGIPQGLFSELNIKNKND